MTDVQDEVLHRSRVDLRRNTKGMLAFLLAGATYWASLAIMGFWHEGAATWYWVALFGTGALYPLARLFGSLLGTQLVQKGALATLLASAFLGMMLFWPMAIAALWTDAELFVLILAIGLSLHLPVVGWVLGLAPIFVMHCLARAVGSFAVWYWYPGALTTSLPSLIAVLYLVTGALTASRCNVRLALHR